MSEMPMVISWRCHFAGSGKRFGEHAGLVEHVHHAVDQVGDHLDVLLRNRFAGDAGDGLDRVQCDLRLGRSGRVDGLLDGNYGAHHYRQVLRDEGENVNAFIWCLLRSVGPGTASRPVVAANAGRH